MKRFLLLVIALLTFASAPQSAFSDNYCDDMYCKSKHWWVEVAGDGNCYVNYGADQRPNYTRWYFSPMLAYIAVARNPACYRTTEWLMHYEYIRRAVR